MLLSPALCHDKLEALIAESSNGPHIALIATPNGQLVSSASIPIPEEEGESDEPWLDEPERIRLLLGLLSQWEEDTSPKVECELGKLYFRSIALPPPPEVTTSHGAMPSYRMPVITRFVLLVNGTAHTSWSELESKSSSFSLETKTA